MQLETSRVKPLITDDTRTSFTHGIRNTHYVRKLIDAIYADILAPRNKLTS